MPRKSFRFRALAVDYDDTLATEGTVTPAVFDGLRRLKDSGRQLLLVTGREIGDLERVGPDLVIFDRIVAENGAVLYRPAAREEVPLGRAPSSSLLDRLRQKRVSPVSVGRVIVATREPEEVHVLEAIRELGLELEIIFNKGAVMILPSGINKASGLACALRELKLDAKHVVGIGDAENDHAFLDACGLGVAVANAIPALKQRAHLITRGSAGDGVLEVIEQLVSSDLASVSASPGS